jgi:hypothetical protein
MNHTAPLNDAVMEIINTTSSPFLRANLFGLFLTLQLCQFTQPYGSLLFRQSGGLFWRCNPIASFVEACLITFYLVKAAWKAIWGSIVRPEQKRSGLWKKLAADLHSTASALLLLRGASCHEDDELMDKLLDQEPMLPPSSQTEEPESYEMSSATTSASRNGINEPQTGVLRRRTTELEANLPPNSQLSSDQPARSLLLRKALGSNALAHREWRIDLVTAVSVLLVCVKVVAISGAAVFRVAASLLIMGWLSVQLLLIIFHSHETLRPQEISSLEKLDALQSELDGPNLWNYLFLALEVPFFGYAGYTLAFRPLYSDPFGIVPSVVEIFIYVVHFMAWLLLPVGTGFSFVCLIALLLSFQDFREKFWLGAFGLLSPVFLWASAGVLSIPVTFKDMTMVVITFPEDSILRTLVTHGFANTVYYLWRVSIVLLVVSMLLGWFQGLFERDKLLPYPVLERHRTVILNGTFTVAASLWYFLLYRPEGTYKPEWIEWLG